MSDGYTLDTGGLIAFDREDRRVVSLVANAQEMKDRITIPATALAQVARRLDRQARLARLLRHPTTDVRPLDRVDAVAVGRLLAASRTTDIVDAHVVMSAGRARQPIVTSDPDDLRYLDPSAELIII